MLYPDDLLIGAAPVALISDYATVTIMRLIYSNSVKTTAMSLTIRENEYVTIGV